MYENNTPKQTPEQRFVYYKSQVENYEDKIKDCKNKAQLALILDRIENACASMKRAEIAMYQSQNQTV